MIGSGCYYLISNRSQYYIGVLSRRRLSQDYFIIISGTRHHMRDGVGRYYYIIIWGRIAGTGRGRP